MIYRLIITGFVWIAGMNLCIAGIRSEKNLNAEWNDIRDKGDTLEEMSRRPLNASQRDKYNEIAKQARRLLINYYQTHSGQDYYNGWSTWATCLWSIYSLSFSPSCYTVFEVEELYWESVDLLENAKLGNDVRNDVWIAEHFIRVLDGFVSRWYPSNPEICAGLIDETYEKIYDYSLHVNQLKPPIISPYDKTMIPRTWSYNEMHWEYLLIRHATILPPDRQKAFINERIPLFMTAVSNLPEGVERTIEFWAKAMRQWYPSGDYGDIFVEAWQCWRKRQWDKSQSLFLELIRLYPETAGYTAIKKYLSDCEAGIRASQVAQRSQTNEQASSDTGVVPNVTTNGANFILPITHSVTLAVAVREKGKLIPDLTDYLEVKLSANKNLHVLARKEIDLIWNEQVQAASSSESQRLRLCRLLRADYFICLILNKDTAKAFLEVIAVAGGQTVLAKTLSLPTRNPDVVARAVFQEIRDSKWLAPVQPPAGGVFVALAQPLIDPEAPLSWANQKDTLANELADQLVKQQVPLLHRQYLETLVTEHWWEEKGLMVSDEERCVLQGARFLLLPRLGWRNGSPLLELVLLDVASVRRIAQRQFAVRMENNRPVLDAAISSWVRESLKDTTTKKRPTVAMEKGSAVQPEVLEPFYQGILLHNQGKAADAIGMFTLAYERDKQFAEPVRWIQSCYRVLGFNEVVKRLDDYFLEITTHRVANLPYYNPKKLAWKQDGFVLLGLTAAKDIPPSRQAMMLHRLVSQINADYGPRLFLPEDMALLRKEYDGLVGLEQVAGPSWQMAPSLLFANILTGNVEPIPQGYRLEIRLVKDMDPRRQHRQEIILAADQAQWPKAMRKGMDAIIQASSNRVPENSSLMPKSVVEEDEATLFHKLHQKSDDITRIKLFSLNPTNALREETRPNPMDIGGGLCAPWSSYVSYGLDEWVLKQCAHNETIGPWLELADINGVNPTGSCQGNCPSYIAKKKSLNWFEGLRCLAMQHPNHPAGMIARYNLLLSQFNKNNVKESLAEINEIISGLEHARQGLITGNALPAMKDFKSALETKLGYPTESRITTRLKGYILSTMPTIISNGNLNCHLWATPLPYEFDDQSEKTYPHDEQVTLVVFPWVINGYANIHPLEPNCLPLTDIKTLLELCPMQPRAMDYVSHALCEYTSKWEYDEITEEYADVLDTYTQALCAYFRDYGISFRKKWYFRPGFWLQPFLDLSQRGDIMWGDKFKPPGEVQRQIAMGRQELTLAIQDVVQSGINLADLDKSGHFAGVLDRAEWYSKISAHSPEKETLAKQYLNNFVRLKNKSHFTPMRESDYIEGYRIVLWFFKEYRYDIAEECYREIVGWKDNKGQAPEPELYANALYILALLNQRNGNIPEAFRWAQLALKETEGKTNQWQQSYQLYDEVEDSTRGGHLENLESLIREFMARLRRDPKTPFVHPFHQ